MTSTATVGPTSRPTSGRRRARAAQHDRRVDEHHSPSPSPGAVGHRGIGSPTSTATRGRPRRQPPATVAPRRASSCWRRRHGSAGRPRRTSTPTARASVESGRRRRATGDLTCHRPPREVGPRHGRVPRAGRHSRRHGLRGRPTRSSDFGHRGAGRRRRHRRWPARRGRRDRAAASAVVRNARRLHAGDVAALGREHVAGRLRHRG